MVVGHHTQKDSRLLVLHSGITARASIEPGLVMCKTAVLPIALSLQLQGFWLLLDMCVNPFLAMPIGVRVLRDAQ